MTLPKCAVLTCPITADPRWFARDTDDHPVMICDGHAQMPKPSEVAKRPSDLTARDLALRIVRSDYSPTPREVECVARALLGTCDKEQLLADLALADATNATLQTERRQIEERVARIAAGFGNGLAQPIAANLTMIEQGIVGLRTGLPAGAAEWLLQGERGISSETIFSHLTGIPLTRHGQMWPPADAHDLARCRRLLDQVPKFRAALPRMAELGDRWAALIARWDEVCALMDEEAPDWRRGNGTAPRTNDLLFRIERQVLHDRAVREQATRDKEQP